MPSLFWIALAAVSAWPPPSRTLYVSPHGSDSNPGTRARPLATLEGARDAIRARRHTTGTLVPYRVLVRGGTYQMHRTLVFEARDSHVCYAASPGERPLITGGWPLKRSVPVGGGVFAATLRGTPLQGRDFRVVVFDGKRQHLARYPNRDPRDRHGGKWAYVDGKRLDMYADSPPPPGAASLDTGLDFWQRNYPELKRRLLLRPEDSGRWKDVSEAEVSLFPRFNWSHYLLAVESLEEDGRTLRVGPGSFYEIRPGDRYFVRNLREELDAPGEWYHDRSAHQLLFYPQSPPRGRPVHAALIHDAIQATGVDGLTLTGFTIECVDGSGVVLRDCTRVTVAACILRNLGDVHGGGVVVEGGRENRIVCCDIRDVGSHGIRLGGGDHHTLTPGANWADNNVIQRVGQVERGANGIQLTGALNRVTHNLITDTPHSGILVWGSMHRIEYNRLLRTCLETEDAGGIGGGAIDWLSWQGVVIRYNWIADTMGYGYDPSVGRWRSPYFASALYPDWAASGVTIEGNVLLRSPRSSLMVHSGRDNRIVNNLLVDGGEALCQWTGWTTSTGFWSGMVAGWTRNYEQALRVAAWRKVPTLKDPRKVPLTDGRVMTGNIFRRNILVARSSATALFQWDDVPEEPDASDYNVVWSGGHSLRTGVFTVKRSTSGNLLANPGVEEGPALGLPTGWAWWLPADETVSLRVEAAAGRGGSRALAVRADEPSGGRKVGANTMISPGPPLPFAPGKAYRFSCWLRAEGQPANLALQAYSWKANTHSWYTSRAVSATTTWRRHELVFRTPARGDSAYRPTMDTLYTRISVPQGPTRLFMDDISLEEVELLDEWTAWRRLGRDRHSVAANPLFVDSGREDFRLRPNSPALRLGFRPLPLERIGPYRSPLRASWPVLRGSEQASRRTPRR